MNITEDVKRAVLKELLEAWKLDEEANGADFLAIRMDSIIKGMDELPEEEPSIEYAENEIFEMISDYYTEITEG